MGLKMNAYGLIYNDQNTSSSQEKNVNIQTSSKAGKYHVLSCMFCGAPNKIPLAVIQQRLEIDFKNNPKRLNSLLSFRCGLCNMPISTTISKKGIDIYTSKEYYKEIGDFTEKMKRNNTEGMSKQKYEDKLREADIINGNRR